MTTISVRAATAADATIISDCNRAMALETEDMALREEVILNGVKRLLARPEYGFYVMAEKDGDIAGTLMVTTEWSDWRDGLFWWIQSVYVMPQFRRQGVYRAMYDFIRERAKDYPDVRGYRLYVERENTVAQQTYQSLGMHATDYYLYEELLPSTDFLVPR
jgi:GNAT superfamily N-acetyltransferase